MTPVGRLNNAILSGDLKEARKAIEQGADISLSRIFGESPLKYAASRGDRPIASLLVSHGQDVNEVRGARKMTLLHYAAATSNFGMASILLDLGANPNARMCNEATPLHIAACSGQGYLAEKLIEHRANLDLADRNGRTALHCAVEKADAGMVRLLLKHNSNPNKVDRRNQTALSIACKSGLSEIEGLLVSAGADAQKTDLRKTSGRDSKNNRLSK